MNNYILHFILLWVLHFLSKLYITQTGNFFDPWQILLHKQLAIYGGWPLQASDSYIKTLNDHSIGKKVSLVGMMLDLATHTTFQGIYGRMFEDQQLTNRLRKTYDTVRCPLFILWNSLTERKFIWHIKDIV